MTRATLKLAPAALSLERQALADAIADAGPKREAADEARARAEAARGALAHAVAAVPAAERAVEAARARIVANPGADRTDLRRCRSAVTDAADDLAIAREVAERIEADLVQAERADRYAAESVERAAERVVVGAFPALIDAAERAARDAAGLAFAAQWVATNGDAFDGERATLGMRPGWLNPRSAYGMDGNAATAAEAEARAPWIAARAALLSDPAAPLPAL